MAIEDLDEALRLNPQDAVAYNDRGVNYYKLYENALAIRDYSEAIRINPQFALAYTNRATAHSSIGDNALASADRLKAEELERLASY